MSSSMRHLFDGDDPFLWNCKERSMSFSPLNAPFGAGRISCSSTEARLSSSRNRISGVRERLSIGEKLIHLAFRADARSIRQYEEVKGRIARNLGNIKLRGETLIRAYRIAVEGE